MLRSISLRAMKKKFHLKTLGDYLEREEYLIKNKKVAIKIRDALKYNGQSITQIYSIAFEYNNFKYMNMMYFYVKISFFFFKYAKCIKENKKIIFPLIRKKISRTQIIQIKLLKRVNLNLFHQLEN